MAVLDIEDLVVSYGKSQVVNGVSLTVEEGELVSIVGPNGAGKTSVLDSLLNYTDWEGEIEFRGQSIKEKAPYEIANMGMSLCMEESNAFLYMTVEENLLAGAHTQRSNASDQLDMVYDLFPVLKERTTQRADTLSGGERKMVAIGKAMMSDPDLLVLDEPTLGLAPVIIDKIADAIDRLRKQELSVLLVEQNVTFGFEHADEVILMETGKFVTRGTLDDLRDNEYVSEVFLGMPSAE